MEKGLESISSAISDLTDRTHSKCQCACLAREILELYFQGLSEATKTAKQLSVTDLHDYTMQDSGAVPPSNMLPLSLILVKRSHLLQVQDNSQFTAANSGDT